MPRTARPHGPLSERWVRVLTLVILFLVSLLNYLDRFVLGILLPAIKSELSLNDTQLGFLAGGAVSIFYVLASVPIGRLADRYSRKWIIGASVAAWSAMTAACGLAYGFAGLAVARILVGVGEAGATAPSAALISDLFGPRRRATALSIYAIGLPAGILVAYMIGGKLSVHTGWRTTLFAFGLSGLALALLIVTVLPEPKRAAPSLPIGMQEPTLRSTLAVLLKRKSYVHLCFGSGLFTVIWLGLLSWLPSHFMRSFGLPMAEVSMKLALILGFSQLLGLVAGGMIADRLSTRDRRWYLWICAVSSITPLPLLAVAMLWPRPDAAFAALFPLFALGLLQGAPALAAVQAVAGPRARAVAASTYLMIVNVVAALGSLLIGFLSDRLAPSFGANALGTSILLVAIVAGTWSAIHFLLGARTIRADVAAASDSPAEQG